MYCLECTWQPVFILRLVTTQGVVGNGVAEGWREWALVNVGGNDSEVLGKNLILFLCYYVRLFVRL